MEEARAENHAVSEAIDRLTSDKYEWALLGVAGGGTEFDRRVMRHEAFDRRSTKPDSRRDPPAPLSP